MGFFKNLFKRDGKKPAAAIAAIPPKPKKISKELKKCYDEQGKLAQKMMDASEERTRLRHEKKVDYDACKVQEEIVEDCKRSINEQRELQVKLE